MRPSITLMISIKINNVDLVGCKILTNLLCCVRVGSQTQWTSVCYGAISHEFNQQFTFKPEAHLYSISVHHNKDLSESLIVGDTFAKDDSDGMLLLGKIDREAFPTKLKHISRAVYATGNPEYCKAALVNYQVTMSVPALKAMKKLVLQHEQDLKEQAEAQKRQKETQERQEEPVAEDRFQKRKEIVVVEAPEIIEDEDEQKVVFKNTRPVETQRKLSEERSHIEQKPVVSPISQEKKLKQISPRNRAPQPQLFEDDDNFRRVKGSIIKSGSQREEIRIRDEQDKLIESEQLNAVKALVSHRQDKSHISKKRNLQARSRYNFDVSSPSKSDRQSEFGLSEVDLPTYSKLEVEKPGSNIQQGSQFTKGSNLDSTTNPGSDILNRQRVSTFQMKLRTIEPVEEEEDDATDKHYRRNTETNIDIFPGSPVRMPSQRGKDSIVDSLPFLSPRRPLLSRGSKFSQRSPKLQQVREYLESSNQQRSVAQQSAEEYLILNTIIFQNMDRRADVRPTCLMLQHQSTLLYTQSICEKSILFTRQIIPLKKSPDSTLIIHVYEEFDEKRILFGKADITLQVLRKNQGARTLKLAVELCNVRVGQLFINHEFSTVHPNNKDTVRTRQYSLQQKTINRNSLAATNRQSAVLPRSRSRRREHPQSVLSSVLPPLRNPQ